MNNKTKTTLSGLLFASLGLLFLVASTGPEIGTISTMGPGYMPRALSIFLIAIGVLIIIKGIRDDR